MISERELKAMKKRFRQVRKDARKLEKEAYRVHVKITKIEDKVDDLADLRFDKEMVALKKQDRKIFDILYLTPYITAYEIY